MGTGEIKEGILGKPHYVWVGVGGVLMISGREEWEWMRVGRKAGGKMAPEF